MPLPSWIKRDPAYWNRGIIAQPRGEMDPLVAAPSPLPVAAAQDIVLWDYARPVAQQGTTPSCGGWAWARAREYQLGQRYGRNFLPEGVHIDGTPIWEYVRKTYYAGDMDGGVLIGQAFRAAVACGVLPVGTVMVEVAITPDAICQALRRSAVVACTYVHDGWFDLAPNGCINHDYAPMNGNSGHAWVIAGMIGQEGDWYVSGDTQLGPDYGYHGYFLMSLAELKEGQIAACYGFELPARDNEDWRGCTCKVNDKGERVLP